MIFTRQFKYVRTRANKVCRWPRFLPGPYLSHRTAKVSRYSVTRITPCHLGLERVMGIEPTFKAWEALVLPLNYTREFI